MPLLIDTPRWPAHGRLWAHLISDTSFNELHAFAGLVGLPPRSFEGDHYDVPAERYDGVVAAGARPVSIRELVVALHTSGLRRPKRKGERVLTSTLLPDAGPPAGARVDLLASTLPPPVAPARVEVLLLRHMSRSPRTSVLVVHDENEQAAWSLPGAAPSPGNDLDNVATRAVRRQTGVQLDPAALRVGGHLRALASRPTTSRPTVSQPIWTTIFTSTFDETLAADAQSGLDARWWPTDGPRPGLTAAAWWPLVGWLLDRRQPLTR